MLEIEVDDEEKVMEDVTKLLLSLEKCALLNCLHFLSVTFNVHVALN